jgi:C-terminal processing protease CtpA/Prc
MTTVKTREHWVALFVVAIILVLLLAGMLLGQERYRPPVTATVVEITAVQPYGPAYRAGLEVDDRILEVGGVGVRSLAELRQLLGDAGDYARLTVQDRRTGKLATVHVYPERGRIGIDARMVVAYPYARYPY